MTNDNGNSQFTEAKASWNTKYIDPKGFECQITLRDEVGSDLLEKAASAVNYLLEKGCTPYVYYRTSARQVDSRYTGIEKDDTQSHGKSEGNLGWCPIHDVEMQKWSKNGKIWYSHKIEDGSWCSGRVKNGNNK